VRIHDLRHTFASWLITYGESLACVKDQMGHRSIQITVDIYGHLILGANRQAVNRLTEMVENPQPIRNRLRGDACPAETLLRFQGVSRVNHRYEDPLLHPSTAFDCTEFEDCPESPNKTPPQFRIRLKSMEPPRTDLRGGQVSGREWFIV